MRDSPSPWMAAVVAIIAIVAIVGITVFSVHSPSSVVAFETPALPAETVAGQAAWAGETAGVCDEEAYARCVANGWDGSGVVETYEFCTAACEAGSSWQRCYDACTVQYEASAATVGADIASTCITTVC